MHSTARLPHAPRALAPRALAPRALALAALALLLPVAPAAGQNTITFSTFPGPDGILGTPDDVAVNAGSTNGTAVFFTTEFARLVGSAGLLVDSGLNPGPDATGLGAIVDRAGNRILVQARPDAGPGQFSFADVRFRFVDPTDGTSAVTVGSIGFDFVAGIAPGHSSVARFYGAGGDLLGTVSYVDGVGSPNVFFSSPAGIARVDIATTFSVATDNVVLPAGYQPVSAVPEPATVVLLAAGLAGVGVVARRRARR